MTQNTPEKIFKFFDDHNLGRLVKYHNDIRGMISHFYQEAKSPELEEEKRKLEEYTDINSLSCFLLMYSHLEEALYNLWLFKHEKRPPCGSGLERHKQLMNDLGIDIGDLSDWQVLQDASEVRNCILHANSRPDLMKNPSKIVRIVEKYKPNLEIEGKQIIVRAEYLRTIHRSIRNLRDKIIDAE